MDFILFLFIIIIIIITVVVVAGRKHNTNISNTWRIKLKIKRVLYTQWRYIGEWRYNATYVNLDTRWKWAVSFTSSALNRRGEGPRYLLNRRLGALEK